MENVRIFAKKVAENAKLPTRGSASAAGMDIYAYIPEGSVTIKPGEVVKISSGFSMELPEGYWGGIYARSGLSVKQGLRPANCSGVVDSDFRGEVIVALYNDSSVERVVCNGDRIAQLVIHRVEPAVFEEIDSLTDTERGTGGFGSTGIR